MTTNEHKTEITQHSGSPITKLEGVRVGNTTAIAFSDNNTLNTYKERLLSHSYEISETKHFVVCQHALFSRIILLHTFQQTTIDADLICFIEYELTPFGFMHSTREFGATLFAIMASTFSSPRHQPSIWRCFCVNTLEKLREQLADTSLFQLEVHPYITPFTVIYQRVKELFTGERLLDVGCSFGFLPILMEEHLSDISIVGMDNNPDMIRCATDIASVVRTKHTIFYLHDILAPNETDSGSFDTITALHILEHIPEKDISIALTHLLQLTSKRLIIAVPYEEQMEKLYGHQQLFTPEKLQNWGKWCVEYLQGAGHFWCEDVMGGMLIIDKDS